MIRTISRAISCAALLVATFFVASCAQQAQLKAANGTFVHAHTAGVIPRGHDIEIEFVTALQGFIPEPRDLASLVSVDPPVEGAITWSSPERLVFTPSAPLKPDSKYVVHFHADKLKALVADASDFDFSFQTIKPSFDVKIDGLETDAKGKLQLKGTLVAADKEDATAIERSLTTSLEGKVVDVAWTHKSDGLTHEFVAAAVPQSGSASSVTVMWNGKAIGSDVAGEQSFPVPAAASFELLSSTVMSEGERYLELGFTENLDASQDVASHIRISSASPNAISIKTDVKGSKVRVWADTSWPKNATLVVEPGIRSTSGHVLAQAQSRPVNFPDQKPAVRFVGTGVILPTTLTENGTATVPIETMNLRYVMVEAIRVYTENVPQFLQINTLDTSRELERVGKVVWRDVVDLGWKNDNEDKWVRYGLDVSKLVAKYPEGLFHLRVTFAMPHVWWPVDNAGSPQEVQWTDLKIPDGKESESSYWDDSEDYYSEDSRYENRTNPAKPEYYKKWYDHDIAVERNFMISDIGIMAKRGIDGSYAVTVTDLKQAVPLAGAEVQLLDYTRQVLARGVSKADGSFAVSALKDRPWFVVARFNGQSGYLRMAQADTLSVSQFDISGDISKDGIKGFIYGERGVWRPGDKIYLHFVLWDPNGTLPADHPVKVELWDPRKNLADTHTSITSNGNMYQFVLATDQDAETGTWLARVRVGSSVFDKPIKIEMVEPNRLKIDFALASGTSIRDGRINAKLGASWLTGLPSPGLAAKVGLTLTPGTTTFPSYPNYTFNDPSKTFTSAKQEIFDSTLDQSGSARITYETDATTSAPGKLLANFDTRVFEPSGAFSVDAFTVDFNPFQRYVGILPEKGDAARGMLLTDTDHVVSIVLVDPDGKPVNSGSVHAELYKLNWRWWWEAGQDSDNIAQFMANNSLNSVTSGDVNIKNGKGEWKFQVKYPEWGRFLIRVTDTSDRNKVGHSSAVVKYIDWPGWAGRQQKDGPGGSAMLVLNSEKPSYNVGEKIRVTLPGNAMGRFLVSLERAGKLLKQEWVTPTGTGDKAANTVYEFPATADMAPNIYVHVTFIQPHRQTVNDAPIRTYGVLPILVQDPDSHLSPVIVSDDVFKPNQQITVKVSESSGKPMTYSLAVVDEGLLTLTRYKAPDPWTTFFRREGSQLDSWDLFSYVAGAISGRIDNLLAIGGGDDGANAAGRKANRFQPVVLVLSPQTLAAGATNVHQISLPNYMGAVRIMVVGTNVSKKTAAFGAAEKSVPVKQDLMVLPTLPRSLTIGDEADVPVSVFYSGSGKASVPVSIAVKGNVSVTGATMRTLNFTAAGEQIIRFRLKSNGIAGSGSVTVSSQFGSDVSTQTVDLPIRNPVAYQSVARQPDTGAALKPGDSWSSPALGLIGTLGTNRVQLELSVLEPVDLGKRLDYLITYPHGCIEQTTSSVFPQLYLGDVVELSADQQNSVKTNIIAGIERLKSFQTASGGFSYWPGEDTVSDWGTNYAGHFLVEARRAGYSVPSTMMNAWVTYELQAANSWNQTSTMSNSDNALTQAYRLYILALNGNSEILSAMNRLRDLNISNAYSYRWRLAAAYALLGQTDAAKTMLAKATIRFAASRALDDTFASDTRDKAMLLETYALLGMSTQAFQLARDVGKSLSAGAWMSTQETAWSIIGLSRVMTQMAGNGSIKVDLVWNGQKQSITSSKPVFLTDLDVNQMSAVASFTLTNRNQAPVFPRLILRGVPPLGKEVANASGMKIDVNYKVKGSDGLYVSGLDAANLGDDVTAEITVTNTSNRDYKNLALDYPVASGFTILNQRMSAEGQASGADGNLTTETQSDDWGTTKKEKLFEFQDLRDDRILTYFDLAPRVSKTFTFNLSTTYQGKFWVPSVRASAMYDDAISALVTGYPITVDNGASSGK